MKKQYVYLLFYFLVNNISISNINAQSKLDYQWLSGYAKVHLVFDFEKGMNIQTIPTSGKLFFAENSSSICDDNGHLILSTNGCSIFNNKLETLHYGNVLNPGDVYIDSCVKGGISGGYTGFQGCIFLPHPKYKNQYYLFHKGGDFYGSSHPFYYTKIDITKLNGDGDVLVGNVPIMKDTLSTGLLTAVQHQNGKDWWLINNGHKSNKYFVTLATEDTVFNENIQTIGDASTIPVVASGQAVFTPDGKKYIWYAPKNGVFIFDFDRATGLLSNYKHLSIGPLKGEPFEAGGCAVSPNSRFLYITLDEYLYQYDLEASDIKGSEELIAQYDGFHDVFATYFYTGHLAPDCKIYWTSQNAVRYLHIMNHPNRKGKACDFQQHSLKLPDYIGYGSIPNVPHYRLGSNPCDSTLVGIKEQWDSFLEKNSLQLSPNPASDEVRVSFLSEVKLKKIEVRNLVGEVLQSISFGAWWEQREIIFSTEGLPAGVYVVVAYLEEKIVTQKLVVVR